MKRTTSILLLALLILVVFPSRAAQRDDQAKSSGTPVAKSSKKTTTISGIVGSDGKTLVRDRDNRVWKVVNPEALLASEGRHVTVKAYADIRSSEISVTVVRLTEERTTAKLDDAAFRR